MALSDKNLVVTPNIGAAADPKIVFSGADASTAAQNITLTAYPTNGGTLSFDGSTGQLFSVTNSMSGTIFSANDVSGIPSIEVIDTGLVKIAQYSGNLLLGSGTDTGLAKLQVTGSLSITGNMLYPTNSKSIYGPNSTWSSYLHVGGDGVNNITRTGTIASVVTTNGNLHLDSGSDKAMYLNYYSGTGGINFGNGANGANASVTAGGVLAATNVTIGGNQVLHAGNYSSYALPLSGGNMSGAIGRTAHAAGFFQGSYNNIGSNSAKSNPIYTIGSSYNPTDTTIGGMYGIGYSHNDFFGNNGGAINWGLYVVANGAYSAIFSESGAWVKNTLFSIAGNTALHAGNYTSYSPTLTGGSASGTWGISITGTAAALSTTSTISSYMGDSGVLFQSYNASASNAAQFNITHALGAVTISNARGALTLNGNVSGSSGSTTGNAATASAVTMSAARTDAAAYPVVWATTGSTSQMYSATAVNIQSSTGTLNATKLNAGSGGLNSTYAIPDAVGANFSGLTLYSDTTTSSSHRLEFAHIRETAGATSAGTYDQIARLTSTSTKGGFIRLRDDTTALSDAFKYSISFGIGSSGEMAGFDTYGGLIIGTPLSGTANPTSVKLHVMRSGGSSIWLNDGTTYAATSKIGEINSVNGDLNLVADRLGQYAASRISLKVDNTEVVAVTGAGLVFANGTSPNSNTIQFGDNTGWNFRFMTSVSGTPTTRFTFSDAGAFTAVSTIAASNFSGSHSGTSSGTNTGDNAGVTSVAGVTPIVSSGGTTPSISHATSGATAGTYNNVTVNTFGHVTAGSNAAYLTAEADTLATVTARGATTTTPVTLQKISWIGEGGNSNNTFSANHYSMGQAGGAWTNPYPDLIIGMHTGIRIGAHYNYQGTRFYNNSPSGTSDSGGGETELMSIGNGDNHVRVAEIGYAGNSFRAPIFYDSNDTAYYGDFASTSDTAQRMRGGTVYGPNVTWGAYLLVGGDGRQNYTNSSYASVCTTNGNLHLDSGTASATHINWYDGTDLLVGAGDSATLRFKVYGVDNYSYATGSMRAPLFYDSDNTAYYLDPNSTSNFVGLTVANTITGSITGTAASETLATVTSRGNVASASIGVPAGDGIGYSFWGTGSAYKISMGVGSLYQYGPVIDYSIKMQMDAGSTGRGFTWGRDGVAPVAGLNSTSGNFQTAGTITAGGNITSTSDGRLKIDLEVIPDALSKVKQLTGYTYTRTDGNQRQTGLIAQDVQKVLPEAVVDGEYLSLAYGNMAGLFIQAIKEQQSIIDSQESRIARLEALVFKLTEGK